VLQHLAATVAVLAGISPSSGGRAAAAVEVADMRGRRVTLTGPPARIVSLAPSMTEIVYALGAASSLVGVSDFCDFPPDARRKPRVGGVSTPNLEVILTLKPDLVLATPEGNREEDVLALERLRIPVFVVTPVDFASVLESVSRVGAVIAREDEARRLVAEMSSRADAIARAVAGVRRPRVLYVIWGDPLIVAGRGTLITDLLRRAGGESITGDEPAPYPRFAMEEVVARAPDWIIIGQHSDIPVEARLREWRGLTLLAAAREGRVRAVDGDLVHRPGPRIVEGLTALARIFHPGLAP
jgi:iron complex transport system substrate-binding protein